MAGFEGDLETLLAPLPAEIGGLARRLVFAVSAHPELSGKVKFGWRSVNFRHEAVGHVCAVFPYSDRVSLYFEQGRLLEQGSGLLEGDLKKGAFLRLRPGDEIPEDTIGILLAEAIALGC
ncbi:MAG TPA: DUF1801 domain-containing protein [Devosia sp.]|jgi:hypothetical protein|nr:DUF1801 domain-containing protein [Devosia sp.]